MGNLTKDDFDMYLGQQIGLIKEARESGDKECEGIAIKALISILSDAEESGFSELKEEFNQQLIKS